MVYAKVVQKENGFMVQAYNDEGLTKEIVVEGKSAAKKVGTAILTVFKALRKPREKKGKGEAAE